MRGKAVYRALLHCYPAAFRHEYGNQMVLMFAEQTGEARRTGGRLQASVVWLEAALDALAVAPKEHGHVILQDLRYALRTLAARPSFTAVAIISRWHLALERPRRSLVLSMPSCCARCGIPTQIAW